MRSNRLGSRSAWRRSMRAQSIGTRVSETTAGKHDRDRERDREFAEQAPDHTAHEQQRDEHRDQRHGQREDSEADLPGPGQRGFERVLPSSR